MDLYQRKRDITVCGVGVCPTTKSEFVKEAFSMPASPVSATIDLVGVPAIISAKENPKLMRMYSECSFAAIDGMPVVNIARKRGFDCERCSGPDIMGMMFEESIRQNKTHFFYGGKNEEVLEKLRSNLEKNYQGIKIMGMYAPPFRPLTAEEDAGICETINELRPDFLWVGIGAPKQEMWMWEHREKIRDTVMIGVGAAFDFFAGSLDKAPEWMENASIEWLYRLCKEPKRLWKRYVLGGVKWLYYRTKESIRGVNIKR